ncbi:MAG: lipoyl synthase [Deltaproteobacteria bacterium]|nr:lipoyl synthase [Deltaproteobacteria bacterium]
MAGLPIVHLPEGAQPSPSPAARPDWLRVRAPGGGRVDELAALLAERRLHTVCSSAACPNRAECWSAGTATFLILGNRCTRACRFCDVQTSATPEAVDLDEPVRLAEAAALLALSHVVITGVTRDDLPDGGARQFARCLHAVRARLPHATLEVLVSDLGGDEQALQQVLDAAPDVFAHNLETCERLTPQIRSGAQYRRSLALLAAAKRRAPAVRTKTGLMLGLGEHDDEVLAALADARAAAVDVVTLGQYLRPSAWNAPVERYVTPARFDELGAAARALGFLHVESGPLVRSSYHAERALP